MSTDASRRAREHRTSGHGSSLSSGMRRGGPPIPSLAPPYGSLDAAPGPSRHDRYRSYCDRVAPPRSRQRRQNISCARRAATIKTS
eukprot:scaffold630_cov399-Prasinococcus_capsulatus_cf.AAC.14